MSPAMDGPPGGPLDNPREEREARRRAENLAALMDDRWVIPGTSIRFGLDSLIGIIPGIGDFLGFAMATAIVNEAARVGAPFSVLARMSLNLLADAVLGAVPFLGDVLDFFFRANRKNALLLQEYLENPHQAAKASRVKVALGVTLALVAAALPLLLFLRLILFVAEKLAG